MTPGNVDHVMTHQFGGRELAVQTGCEDVDWSETISNMRKIIDVDFGYRPARVSLNPTFASEVATALDNGDEYTATVEGAPWEVRGHLWVREDQRFGGGHVWVYAPSEPAAVDWGDDVGGTQNVVQVTMNGADPWEFQLNPAFREDLANGLQQEADDAYEDGESYVEIAIDDESPWRIKYGQITIEKEGGEWVVRSTPLMIAADELDWEFSFEEWAEE